MKITILDENKHFNRDEKKTIKSDILKALKLLDQPGNSELCISFVNDPDIRELNKTYRNISRATDVLSFPQDGPDFSILGDILISVDTAKRHADKYGNSLEYEIKKLLVHGILHLLGYDHKKKKETMIMREKEKELLAQI
ncbi:MAG: rRNA maturation RNase YbeY [Candidatus Dadabacteria bacterium]|nr:rRNA maturation RNase YbeY [Candidatus Dadabacteria bacterium]NIS09297.1 rRNA maturation RNase YbeY [Candidatus Dadabacteria bacterium]NIV40787.1 rRNA maturation RNase YbeY [Candidatus Dadabacteria bacterium]NIX14296.1 rRNA maturation RNase YbeY [Candidatus Dadabacteria bacterium]NIY20829.1 rRNA maturation RNase YbeY [Candidatus Dadabacteria bacterium]